jgi:hypothetical protein
MKLDLQGVKRQTIGFGEACSLPATICDAAATIVAGPVPVVAGRAWP